MKLWFASLKYTARLSGLFCTVATSKPLLGVAVTSSILPSAARITAWPPSTWKDRTNVRAPSPSVVTVQPSSTSDAGSGVGAAGPAGDPDGPGEVVRVGVVVGLVDGPADGDADAG